MIVAEQKQMLDLSFGDDLAAELDPMPQILRTVYHGFVPRRGHGLDLLAIP